VPVCVSIRWASHKSNPSCVPQGYAEICNLGHVGGVETPVEGSPRHPLANRALASQATVEGIVLKSAWYLRSKSSVVNDTLGNQAEPRCRQAFRPRGAPWTVTICFLSVSWDSSLSEDSDRMNEQTTASGNGASFSIGDPLEDHGGGLLYRRLWEEGKILFYQETSFIGDPARCQRRLCKRTSLSIGVPLGNLERDSFYRRLWETAEGALP
jgi:hypothetical protein